MFCRIKNPKSYFNMKHTYYIFILLVQNLLFGQGSPDYNGGFKFNFDEEGQKWFRIISWVQAQANTNFNADDNVRATNFQLRRARVLTLSQIHPNFLLVSHFGLNGLHAGNMHAVGKNNHAQLFLHGMWAQWNIHAKHTIGAGLHYQNGINRLNSQSTLNIMTMDNNRSSWSHIGLTDQFARQLGVFFKGKFGRLQYRVSVNDPIANSLDKNEPNSLAAVYRGVELLGTEKAGRVYTGYIDYHFLDEESNVLPYRVGSYLGGKDVFNIGFGFFNHANGSVIKESNQLLGQDVNIFAVDAFYDRPIGAKHAALTAYATFQSNDYGKNYRLGHAYGTGQMLYAHCGYLLDGKKTANRFQPYIAVLNHSYDFTDDNRTQTKFGVNMYRNGHNSKFTVEYVKSSFAGQTSSALALQGMIYL